MFRHGEEILVLLFGAFVNTIYCENSGEDVASEYSEKRKHNRLQSRCLKLVNGNNLSEDHTEKHKLVFSINDLT